MFSVMTCTDMIDMKQPSCYVGEKKIIAPCSQWRVPGTEYLSEFLQGPGNICVLISPQAKKKEERKDEVILKMDTFLQERMV